jgi:ADP-heptose:LPS heptosyltransferase
MAQLCDALAREFNIRTILTGSKEDADFAGAVARSSKSKPVVAAGRTSLMELAALMKRFKAYITPDSAPMHIAAAVGCPFIALFGPTDPRRHMPPSKRRVVLKDDIKCSPCYSPHCRKKFNCMRNITVEEVFDAVKGFLEKGF